MIDSMPVVFVPGLICSARLYGDQIADLWRFGPVMVGDHRRDDVIADIAARILAAAPPRFALIGLSMGGYISFEMMRQQADRIAGLALLDTSARPDRPEQSALRDERIALARNGHFATCVEQLFPLFVHRNRLGDAALKSIVWQMAEDTGADAFIRQQTAIKNRPDSRPLLGTIRCPTLVLVGDGDEATPPELSEEIAAGIKNSKLVVVPDCGHLSTVEQPEAVTRCLAEWLTSVVR